MISRYNPLALVMAVGAVIWFLIAFIDLIEVLLAISSLPEGFDADSYRPSEYAYRVMDALFLMGSAAMVEYLSRISAALNRPK